MSMAYLILPSKKITKEIVVTDYSYTYRSSIQSVQKRLQLQHYPIRATQGDLTFNISCRSEKEWNDVKSLIKDHQESVLTSNITSNGFIRFVYPSQRIDFTILIKSSPGGAVRFQVAPDLNVSAEFIYDNIFSVSNNFTDPGDNFSITNQIVGDDGFFTPAKSQIIYGSTPQSNSILFDDWFTGINGR